MPQQVVQRIAPTPTTGAAVPTGGSAAKDSNEASAAARAPGADNPGAAGAQTVTAKHVEAELNRLEAELK